MLPSLTEEDKNKRFGKAFRVHVGRRWMIKRSYNRRDSFSNRLTSRSRFSRDNRLIQNIPFN